MNTVCCDGKKDVYRLVLSKNGDSVKAPDGREVSVVVLRICHGCGKRYLAPTTSLIYLLAELRELSLARETTTISHTFAEMLEEDLARRGTPSKEEDK